MDMPAGDDGESPGWIWAEGESSPSGGLDGDCWQGEESQRLLGAKLGGSGSLEKNSLRVESDIPESSVGCVLVSTEPSRRRLFSQGRAPHPLASLEHAGP